MAKQQICKTRTPCNYNNSVNSNNSQNRNNTLLLNVFTIEKAYLEACRIIAENTGYHSDHVRSYLDVKYKDPKLSAYGKLGAEALKASLNETETLSVAEKKTRSIVISKS